MKNNEPDLEPLQATPPIDGQNLVLFTYVVVRDAKENDPLALVKVISVHETHESLQSGYVRALKTNKGMNLKWGEVGKWEVVRRAEGDTEATYNMVHVPGDTPESETFMGEKLTRDVIKPEKKEAVEDQAAIDQYKENLKVREMQLKKIELRKKAMSQLQQEFEDSSSLQSYAKLQFSRLQLKSTIYDTQKKLDEQKKALSNVIAELRSRKKAYPHFESQWQNELRRIHKIMNPNRPEENVIDQPPPGSEIDDEKLLNPEGETVDDEFDTGIGVDRRDNGEGDEPPKKTEAELRKEIQESFNPMNPIKKIPTGPPMKKRNKKNRGKK